MQIRRCFLCGHKMAESGLCTNVKCVRSIPILGTVVEDELAVQKEIENVENVNK